MLTLRNFEVKQKRRKEVRFGKKGGAEFAHSSVKQKNISLTKYKTGYRNFNRNRTDT